MTKAAVLFGSAKTRYVYTGFQQIADYDGVTDTLQNRYVYGTSLDEALISVSSGGTLAYLHADETSSIIATTDASANVTNKNKYSPFGEGTPAGTTFGFTGQRFDSETELYYFKRRYYSPKLGRFLQPDSIGYGDGLNMYAFGYNSPVNFRDPFGLAGDDDGRLWGNKGWWNPGAQWNSGVPYAAPPSRGFLAPGWEKSNLFNDDVPLQNDPKNGKASPGGTGVTNYDWNTPSSPIVNLEGPYYFLADASTDDPLAPIKLSPADSTSSKNYTLNKNFIPNDLDLLPKIFLSPKTLNEAIVEGNKILDSWTGLAPPVYFPSLGR